MDDSSFFKEQAERFRDQAGASIDPSVKSTLESLSSGLAAYADGLKERDLQSQIADMEERPRLIADDEFGERDVDILADDGWLVHDDEQIGSDGLSVTKRYLFFAMLLTPSLGVMAWTVVKHGTW